MRVTEATSSCIRQALRWSTRSATHTAALIGETWLTAMTSSSVSTSVQKDATRAATSPRRSPPGGANSTSFRHEIQSPAGTSVSARPSHSP